VCDFPASERSASRVLSSSSGFCSNVLHLLYIEGFHRGAHQGIVTCPNQGFELLVNSPSGGTEEGVETGGVETFRIPYQERGAWYQAVEKRESESHGRGQDGQVSGP
jgi:hypothetical protein